AESEAAEGEEQAEEAAEPEAGSEEAGGGEGRGGGAAGGGSEKPKAGAPGDAKPPPGPMPERGESITEGTTTRWLKEEGDRVEADEPLFEISTDKVDTEVPSPVSGVLKTIKVRED